MDDEKIAALTKATRDAMDEETAPIRKNISDIIGLLDEALEQINSLKQAQNKGFGALGLEKWTDDLFKAVEGYVQKKSAPQLARIEHLEKAVGYLQHDLVETQRKLAEYERVQANG